MNGKYILISLLLFANISSFAQSKKRIMRASILWKIKDPKTNVTSYMIGSIHPLRADSVFKKFPKLYDLIPNSRLFVCEGLSFDSAGINKLTEAFARQPSKTFKQWFGKDSAIVDNFYMKNFNYKELPSSILNNEKLIDQIADIQAMSKLIKDSILVLSGLHKWPPINFDYNVLNAVNDIKMPILQLDEAEDFYQQNIMGTKNWATALIIKNILLFNSIQKKGVNAVAENENYRFIPMMKLYYEKAMCDYNLNDKPDGKPESERNKRWLKKLVPELQKGNVFIMVGIGHFMGNNYGLVPELRKKGFIVTPVNLSPSSNN